MTRLTSTPSPEQNVVRLRRRYLISIGVLLVFAFFGQSLSQGAIAQKESDSRVINLAGRQRMLSQQIAKQLLAHSIPERGADGEAERQSLSLACIEWRSVHRALLDGNASRRLPPEVDPEIRNGLIQLTPVMERILAIAAGWPEDRAIAADTVDKLMTAEAEFLLGMDSLVSALEGRSDRRLQRLGLLEILLFGFSLLAITGQAVLAIRPAFKRLNTSIGDTRVALQSLEAAEQQVSAVLRAIPDGLFVMDRDGMFHSAHQWDTGRRRRIQDHLTPECVDVLLRRADHVLSGDVGPAVLDLMPRANPDHMFEARVTAESDDKVLVVVRDIREQRSLQRALLGVMDAERARHAEEVHDGICQGLIGSLMLARRLGPGEPLKADVIGSLEETLEEARALGRAEFTPRLERAGGLVSALEALAESTTRTGTTTVTTDCFAAAGRGGRDLQSHHLYRIAQEALTNAIRHGRATHIEIGLRMGPDGIHLWLADNGVGFATEDRPHSTAGGLGLASIAMRARTLGAVLVLESSPGAGTRVEVRQSTPPGRAYGVASSGPSPRPSGRPDTQSPA